MQERAELDALEEAFTYEQALVFRSLAAAEFSAQNASVAASKAAAQAAGWGSWLSNLVAGTDEDVVRA